MLVCRAHNLCINNYTIEEQQVASKSRTNVYNYKVSRKKEILEYSLSASEHSLAHPLHNW